MKYYHELYPIDQQKVRVCFLHNLYEIVTHQHQHFELQELIALRSLYRVNQEQLFYQDYVQLYMKSE